MDSSSTNSLTICGSNRGTQCTIIYQRAAPGDRDPDGVPDEQDAFPDDPNEAVNDGDGVGNNADPDDDNDGILDENDEFNGTSESVDTDGDGIGNNADTDDDVDGYSDESELASELTH